MVMVRRAALLGVPMGVVVGVLVAALAAWIAARSRRRELFCAPDTPRFPPAPSWAAKGQWRYPEAHDANSKAVSAMNASGQCFDFVLFGDSITMFIKPDTLKKHFGDLKAATLGVGFDTVEQLAWRITSGAERPAKAPGVMALLIGVNNLIHTKLDASRLEDLLRWLKAAYPSTKLVVVALLPVSSAWKIDIASANKQYSDIAKRLGVTFSTCGSGMDPKDKSLFPDGLHPSPKGQDVILACLRRTANDLLAAPKPGGCSSDAPRFPPMPPWAVKDSLHPDVHVRNAKIVADMNKSGQCFDFLLYGDSITMFHDSDPSVFKKYFGDLRAAALGIGGAVVEDLAWRLTSDSSGAERPARAPRVLAIMIGVNNVIRGTVKTERFEQLVRWLRDAYPSTRIVIMAVLRNTRKDVAALNKEHSDIASRTGCTFVTCGASMDPNDKALIPDGLHPSAKGHDQILGCLRPIVNQLLQAPPAPAPAPAPGVRS